MEVMWRSGSRCHDWRDGLQVRRLLDEFVGLGLAGTAGWTVSEFGGARQPASIPIESLHGHLMAASARGDGTCSMGGLEPRPWELHIVVSPWRADSRSVDGVNMSTLRWESEGFATQAESAALFRAFTDLHGPDNSEFAFVHPSDHLAHLAGDLYKPPLVNSHMVAGAYFALYIGPGQTEFFDIDALAAVRAVRVERDDDRAVWFQGVPVLADAGTRESEDVLVNLTNEMRAALR